MTFINFTVGLVGLVVLLGAGAVPAMMFDDWRYAYGVVDRIMMVVIVALTVTMLVVVGGAMVAISATPLPLAYAAPVAGLVVSGAALRHTA